ncbi:hypothetical protein [Polaribacter sp.]|uniref:hypothetical protein n=1 Tax=Polaribacter sp. TaxID=1920175 RepID=UPI0025E80021|nr:hypothetical protein [Polaribacter sp.]
MRVFIFLIFLFFITSCNKIALTSDSNIKGLDTIVDFTSVDTYPSFTNCDSIIQKINKQNCFRTSIYTKIGEELKKHTFIIKDSINETVLVDLLIDKNGVINYQSLQASNLLKKELPKFDSLVQASVNKLSKVYPAIKRGIPVTTRYQLPIKIQLKN